MPMPERNVEGQYRYGYQGQYAETDPETGMPAFELRLWDARIGRWLTTDPYRQHASPYMGMGNNPISRVDPDGGCDDPPCWDTNGDYNAGSLGEVVITAQGNGGTGNIDLAGMYFGIRDNFNQGFEDRVLNTVDFVQNDLLRSDYYEESLYNGFNNLMNQRTLFNPSDAYLQEIGTNISNMTVNDWAYTAGYSAPDIALGIAGTYTTTLRLGLTAESIFQGSTLGYKSRLFGRWHPKFYPDGVKGSLNRGNFRTGWGHKEGRGDVFRTSFPNGKHKDWFHRY